MARRVENTGEVGYNSGYKEAYCVASEYRENRMYKEEMSDPMIEELFTAAKDVNSYQNILTEMRKGLTK